MIKALKTRCILTKLELEQVSQGGIVLTRAPEENNPRAVIHDCGPDVNINVAVGDVVIVDWRYVNQMEHEGGRYYVVDQANILAVEE